MTEAEAERLLERIKTDLLREAEGIIENAKREVAQHKEEAARKGREDAFKRKEELLKDAKSRAATLRNKIISEAKLRASAVRLEAVNKALDDIFKLVSEKLVEWSKTDRDRYRELLEKFIMEGSLMVSEAVVFVKKDDLDLGLDLDSLSKRIKDSLGVKVKLRYGDEPLKASGGVLIKSLDGKVIINNTFEALVERFKRRLYRHALELLLRD